ncbi:fumarylacetoacetate hydrolase family protein [Microbacterium sp. Sa4CUA7]|uniref:Fumarylacetoacetate hydrolase family protein n=1 Tax=Microbacterium pullorum TaxID=2762236 RepID=A0ABR8S2L9_9MICO|nr:fumarylacetoacetate hydrolase family protein [Microbacterium pullorum]MBD7957715.1 fumarylacetoacetate hydrolase family protein [Microbacterium pullorum]
MRFARVGAAGKEIPVVLHGDQLFDLRGITPDIVGTFLESGTDAVSAALAAGELPEVRGGDVRYGAAIARPSSIICIGMNYAAHAAESGSAPPEDLVVFLKTANTIAGPFDDVALPPSSVKTDWEVELGVVIGQRTSYLDSPAAARAHIAGYVVANDLSEREWQIERSLGQWSKGKSFAGFSPVGPFLVTTDEVDAGMLRVRSWVNGEPRQDSSTADMIFGVDEILYRLSQFLVLEPGDLVLTGTPEGVALSGRFPYLASGDVVELEIDGLGRQRQAVR